MALNIAHGISLNQLNALGDQDYLTAQSKTSTQIQTSAQPIKGSFLFFSVGTSKQHQHGFNQLKEQVRRQYGFELRADDAKTGKITVGSLKQQITQAQIANGKAFAEMFDNVYESYLAKHGSTFANAQGRFVLDQVRNEFLAGETISGARQDQIQNQLDMRAFAHKLDQRFGGGAGATFLNAVTAKFNNGEKLSDQEQTQWRARFSAEKAIGELGSRIDNSLGPAAGQAARNALAGKLAALTNPHERPPVELMKHGQLPEGWVDEALDAAVQAHVGGLGAQLNPAQRQQAIATARGQQLELKDQQARLGNLERGIAGTARDAHLDTHPAKLFAPGAGGSVYRLCEDLRALDEASGGPRLQEWRGSSVPVAARLTEARNIAQLGLQLRQANVPEAEAAYILHMEANLRAKGAGDPNLAQFSPLIATLQDARDLAQLAIGLETQGNPNLSKETVGQLLDLEIAERRAGRGAANFQSLSPHTAALVQDRNALASLQQHSIPLTVYGDYSHRGAQNATEVIHAHRLGIVPEALHQAMSPSTQQIFQQWQQAGFSEAETHAYMLHFDSPAEIQGFQGSLLKHDEIAAYRESGIPYTDATKLGQFKDSNQTGDSRKLGNGAYNTVYLGRYDTPGTDNGYTERVFKVEPDPYNATGDPGNLGRNSLRNCLASALDRQTGFNVLAHTEIGMVGGKLGISMARAKGDEAYAQQVGQKHQQVVTPGSKYAALLKHQNRLQNDPELVRNLCQRYRLTEIRVENNQIVVMPALVAQNKENPQLQKELTKLQLMDALIGNRDRHQSNYFIDFDAETGKVTVTGVDNDDAFNSSVRDPAKLTKHNTAVTLPPVVDREMFDAIDGIDETQYRQSLSHLPRREVDAAVSRLRIIKDHLQKLEDTGRVIEPGDPAGWGSPEVTELFTARNSYVGRDTVVFRGVPYEPLDMMGL